MPKFFAKFFNFLGVVLIRLLDVKMIPSRNLRFLQLSARHLQSKLQFQMLHRINLNFYYLSDSSSGPILYQKHRGIWVRQIKSFLLAFADLLSLLSFLLMPLSAKTSSGVTLLNVVRFVCSSRSF